MRHQERFLPNRVDNPPSSLSFDGNLDPNVLNSVLLAGHEHTTLYADELRHIIESIPHISEKERLIPRAEIQKIKDRPFAIDLGDEARTIAAIQESGGDVEAYWEFFKKQIQYYITESYSDEAVSYQHSLVNDHGNLCLWIDPLGKSAQECYEDGAKKEGPEWYRKRTRREADTLCDLRRQLQMNLGHRPIVEISPAPNDDEEGIQNTTFKKGMSFIRFHQLISDPSGNNNPPHVESFAKKVHLPPDKLSELLRILSGYDVQPDALLGTFIPMGGLDDQFNITDTGFPVLLQSIIDTLEESLSVEERSKYKPSEHSDGASQRFEQLIPKLRKVFDTLCTPIRSGESREECIKKAVGEFQQWEKLLQAHLSGEWDALVLQLVQEIPTSVAGQPNIEERLVAHFTSKEYKPPENSCGSGVGASSVSEGLKSDSQVVSTSSPVFAGNMTYENLSILTSQESVSIRCPGCRKTFPYKISEVKKEGKLKCKGCSNCTECWEPIIMGALQAQKAQENSL